MKKHNKEALTSEFNLETDIMHNCSLYKSCSARLATGAYAYWVYNIHVCPKGTRTAYSLYRRYNSRQSNFQINPVDLNVNLMHTHIFSTQYWEKVLFLARIQLCSSIQPPHIVYFYIKHLFLFSVLSLKFLFSMCHVALISTPLLQDPLAP